MGEDMLNCLWAVCSQDSNTWRIIVKDLTAFATHVDNFDLSCVIIFTYSDDRIEIIDTSINSDCQCSCLGADKAKKMIDVDCRDHLARLATQSSCHSVNWWCVSLLEERLGDGKKLIIMMHMVNLGYKANRRG